jgi:hypothetical protein
MLSVPLFRMRVDELAPWASSITSVLKYTDFRALLRFLVSVKVSDPPLLAIIIPISLMVISVPWDALVRIVNVGIIPPM